MLGGYSSKQIKGGKEMKTAFYAGSFDPFTMGHFNVVQRASKIFDKVIVGIGINSTKKRRFDAQKNEKSY